MQPPSFNFQINIELLCIAGGAFSAVHLFVVDAIVRKRIDKMVEKLNGTYVRKEVCKERTDSAKEEIRLLRES